MRVRIRDNGEVMTTSQFIDWLAREKNTSVPQSGLTLEAMDYHGVDPVMEGPQPTGEPWQSVQQDGVEQIDGQWFTKYVLTPTFSDPEEQAAYVAAWEAARLKEQTPKEISDRQFFAALWKQGHITFEEALDAVKTGTMPATIVGFLELLESYDPTTADNARLLLAGATTFERDNFLIPVFGQMYGMNDDQIDALWRLGASL